LSYYGLESRIVRSTEDLKAIDNKIDYSDVSQKIKEFSNHSKTLLNEAVGKIIG
jgi:hypothetical protein